MVSIKSIFLFTLSFYGVSVLCNPIHVLQQEYQIEAFQRDGDSQSLILRIKPRNKAEIQSEIRQGRQEEEDGSDSASAPFIPAVFPALTKIFTGIITGNFNDIFHGATSFAPQDSSFAIDTVYNQVVGIAAPTSTQKPTKAPLEEAASEAADLSSTTPGSPTIETASRSSSVSPSSVAVGQPLAGQSLIITTKTTTTSKPSANEDDDDESDADVDFSRRIRKD